MFNLVLGCPEMLAEGLAEDTRFDENSVLEWQRQFENPTNWIKYHFYQIFIFDYLNVTRSELEQAIDKVEEDNGPAKEEIRNLPAPTNETCGCGSDLPQNPPSIITNWKDATEVASVCFECFGKFNERIEAVE